jgi:hypothetical protein
MSIGTTAALTAASLATTAGTAGASFIQAHKQKKEMRKAEKEAKKAMISARKKLDVNFYEALSVPMTPYEKERDALLSQGAQVMETAVEGDERGAGTIAGKLMAGQLKSQSDVSDRQTQQLQDRQKTILDEEKRLQTAKFNLDVAEVEGAQLAARDAAEARQQAIQQGMSGVTSLMKQGMAQAPLYGSIFGGQELTDEEQLQFYQSLNPPTEEV